MNGSYQIADPSMYYLSSANTENKMFMELQRTVSVTARMEPGTAVVKDPQAFAGHVLEALGPEAAKLGLQMTELNIWESVSMGFLNKQSPPDELPWHHVPGGLVH
jgi:hypothetical protein